MAEQLSISQHFDTIQHLSSALNRDVMSQLSATTRDVSSTTLVGLSGQTELESSLSTTLLVPTVTTFTPALPSELGFVSGQLETSNITNAVFTVESVIASSSSMMPLWETFFESLLPDIGVSSVQKDLESPGVTDLQSNSGTELCFDRNVLKQTLSSDISLVPSWALQTSLPLTKTCHIISVLSSMFRDEPFKESVKSAHESVQITPSMPQTLPTLLQFDTFSHISLVTESVYLNTAVLTTFAPSVTHPGPLSIFESTRLVSEDHFDPSAPSTVHEPYTTAFIYEMHNPDPSFPLCGQSVAQDSCTPQIKSTDIKNTVEHVLHFLTSYSQDEKHRTAFASQFLMFDSMHLSASTTTEINIVAATPQMDISDTFPSLDASGFSVIAYASFSLLIYQTYSSRSLAKGQPTQQILSTSLSPFYGTSTLLTLQPAVGLSLYRRQSSVQPTPSSSK